MSLCRSELQEIRQIAVGGMARLTLAIHPDGRQLVVRELHRHLAMNFRAHFGFLRGRRMRARLCPHDNLVCPVAKGYCGLVPYEIIEYVPGENLREAILKRSPWLAGNSLAVLRQVAAALNHMHSMHILHLDVKAENVLLDHHDENKIAAKLTDFDLSRHFYGGRAKLRLGTVTHMAPEQLTKGCVTFANDIFAFGVMAYYLVTGKMPFSGFSMDEVRRQQVSRSFEIVEPRRWNPELAPKLNWLILRCLEKDPDKRFPNMAYLAQELGRI